MPVRELHPLVSHLSLAQRAWRRGKAEMPIPFSVPFMSGRNLKLIVSVGHRHADNLVELVAGGSPRFRHRDPDRRSVLSDVADLEPVGRAGHTIRYHATISSITTIIGTTMQGSGCTRRSPSTSVPRRRSSTNEPTRSRRSARPTRNGLPGRLRCPRSPRSRGSTDPTKTTSARTTLTRKNRPPNDH